jgi:hypothetical protein
MQEELTMPRHTRSSRVSLITAIVLSAVSGIWILLATGVTIGAIPRHHWLVSWMQGHSGWMPWSDMMGSRAGHAWVWPVPLGMIAASLVLLGAVLLCAWPRHAAVWSAAILAGAAFNLFLGTGVLIASLLGLIGGTLALVEGVEYPRTSHGTARHDAEGGW